jgi:putative DNA primase/helicase
LPRAGIRQHAGLSARPRAVIGSLPLMDKQKKRRHKWTQIEPHVYVCERCGMEKRNVIEEDGSGWFQTFTERAGEPVRSKTVPPCTGDKSADQAFRTLEERAAAAFAAVDTAWGRAKSAGALTGLIAADGRRTVRVINGELPRVVDEAEAALAESGAGLMVHGNRLVRVGAWDRAQAPKDAPARDHGAAVLFTASPDWLVYTMTRIANWQKYDNRVQDWVRIDAPLKIAKTLIAREGEWMFPALTGFCESPTLAHDGRVISRPGYDPLTGLYLVHNLELGPMGLEPGCRAEVAEESAAFIRDLLQSLPFVADADHSAAIAMVMTALLRRLMPAAPLFAISATAPRSGKSKLARCISLIARGQPASVLALGANEEETEKRVVAALLDGDPLILIDNVSRVLKSDVLCQVTTEPLLDARLLGSSAKVRCPTNCMFIATGNNLTVVGDLAARVVLVRLDAGCERPEERTFDDLPTERRDMERFVLRNRKDAIRAALTITKAYVEAGCPAVDARPWSDFPAWDRLVRRPLIWAGQPDPLDTSRDLRDEDHELVAVRNLLDAWRQWRTEPVTAAQLYQAATETAQTFAGDREPVRPAMYAAVQEMVGDNPRGGGGRALGYKLREYRGRIFGSLRIAKANADGEGLTRWVVQDSMRGT